jgi:hypothetical protein
LATFPLLPHDTVAAPSSTVIAASRKIERDFRTKLMADSWCRDTVQRAETRHTMHDAISFVHAA